MSLSRSSAVCILTAAASTAGFVAAWAPIPPSPAAASAADTFKVDPVHSSLVFGIKHLNVANFYGAFGEVTGEFTLDESGGGSVSVEVQTKSVTTRNDKRDAHIRSADFLNADQFPTATFKSTSVKSTGSGKFEVTGDITIAGVTKPITVPVEHTGTGKGMRGETRAGFEAVFTFNREDFGITFMPDGLGREVRMIVSLEGVQL